MTLYDLQYNFGTVYHMTLNSPNNLTALVKIVNSGAFAIYFRCSVNDKKKAANSYPLTKEEQHKLANKSTFT